MHPANTSAAVLYPCVHVSAQLELWVEFHNLLIFLHPDLLPGDRRELAGVHAAHWELMRLLSSKLGPVDRIRDSSFALQWATQLSLVAAHGPAVMVGREFTQQLTDVLKVMVGVLLCLTCVLTCLASVVPDRTHTYSCCAWSTAGGA